MARVSPWVPLLISILFSSTHSKASKALKARSEMQQLIQEMKISEAKWDELLFDGINRDESKQSITSRDQNELKTILNFIEQDSALSKESKKPLKFSGGSDGENFTLLAVGDVLLHQPLASQGMRDGFSTLWTPLLRSIASADVAYANLEGPAAGNISHSGKVVPDPGRKFDGVAYTGYPRFNYHPSIVDDLKSSGFDIASTANNHAMDRLSIGVDRTVEAFRRAGLPFSGTTSSKDLSNQEYTTFTQSGGLNIAWIACTFSTNGISDRMRQVFLCFQQREKLLE